MLVCTHGIYVSVLTIQSSVIFGISVAPITIKIFPAFLVVWSVCATSAIDKVRCIVIVDGLALILNCHGDFYGSIVIISEGIDICFFNSFLSFEGDKFANGVFFQFFKFWAIIVRPCSRMEVIICLGGRPLLLRAVIVWDGINDSRPMKPGRQPK